MAQIHDMIRSRTVVIVEDELLVRDIATCELEDNGYTVVEFETADAALPYLRTHGGEACVVVTDVQMPGTLNGLQLADIVSQLWPQVPVLVTSGGPLVDPKRLPPCAIFLRKPWHPAEIVEHVRFLARAGMGHAGRAASTMPTQ